MNPNPDTSRPVGPGKGKPFFPPGSTGVTTMRLRAELQHEEAKMRIFKIFIALLVICVGAFLVYSGISYYSESAATKKRLTEAKDALAKLESGLSDDTLSRHARASLLVRIVNTRSESVMPMLSRAELGAAEQENVRDTKEIERLAKIELPAEPEQPGADFIVPSAHLEIGRAHV